MRCEEKKRFEISAIPTSVYRKWYAMAVPLFGFGGAVLFNLLSLSDSQRGIFNNILYSQFEATCIFAFIGFYMMSVLLAGVLFVLRLVVYNCTKEAAMLFIFSIPIGMVMFPIYYIYNLICVITKKRTLLS